MFGTLCHIELPSVHLGVVQILTGPPHATVTSKTCRRHSVQFSKLRDVCSERHGKSKTSERKDMGSTRDPAPTTGDTHRNVLVRSCGIGLSHPILTLASGNSQPSKFTEHVRTRPYQRAPRRPRGGFNHSRSGMKIAR